MEVGTTLIIKTSIGRLTVRPLPHSLEPALRQDLYELASHVMQSLFAAQQGQRIDFDAVPEAALTTIISVSVEPVPDVKNLTQADRNALLLALYEINNLEALGKLIALHAKVEKRLIVQGNQNHQ